MMTAALSTAPRASETAKVETMSGTTKTARGDEAPHPGLRLATTTEMTDTDLLTVLLGVMTAGNDVTTETETIDVGTAMIETDAHTAATTVTVTAETQDGETIETEMLREMAALAQVEGRHA